MKSLFLFAKMKKETIIHLSSDKCTNREAKVKRRTQKSQHASKIIMELPHTQQIIPKILFKGTN